MKKIRTEIIKDSVRESLMLSLYAKCRAMEEWPDIFNDKDCRRVKESIDYDFSFSEKQIKQREILLAAFSQAARQFAVAAEIRKYLKTHPKALVVNLGCGFDTTGHQADNALCTFINIDFADVIELRKKIFPCEPREINIAADLKKNNWIEKIPFREESGAVFFASGVFMYWKEKEVNKFVKNMSGIFHGCELVFDSQNRQGLDASIKSLKKSGFDLNPGFYLNHPCKDIASWGVDIKDISCRKTVWDYIKPGKSVPLCLRVLSYCSDVSGRSRINSVYFR